MQDPDCPPEVRQLGRTLHRWREPIAAWHGAQVTKGPTGSMIIGSQDLGVVDVADEAA